MLPGMPRKDARYHHGNLRAALLQAGEQLLEERGLAALSLRELARAAGVSHTAPYRHFKDKAALLRGIAQCGFERLRADIEAAGRGAGDPAQRLEEAAVAYVEFAVRHPAQTQLMFGGGPASMADDADYRESARAAYRALQEIIGDGIERGAFHGRLEALSVTAWATVHGLSTLITAGADMGADNEDKLRALSRATVRQIIRGLASPA